MKSKENLIGKHIVSFSQYSMFKECPWKWKLSYIDKQKTFSESIHTLFGTSLHETLQCYLIGLYKNGESSANKLPLSGILEYRLKENYKKSKENGNFKNFTSAEEMEIFYKQGILILDFIKKNRAKYFGLRGYELIGIEIPILNKVSDGYNVHFMAYVDVIIKEKLTNKYKIIDIKTSTKGWNQWQKKDDVKLSQLLLYKHFYAKQYNVPVENIDIEFFIVKRELYENCDFPQKRVQKIEPVSGKIKMSKTINSFDEFIHQCFNIDGTYNLKNTYPKIPGENNKNCKFCFFDNKPNLCDKNGK